jgi:hypothetical protein
VNPTARRPLIGLAAIALIVAACGSQVPSTATPGPIEPTGTPVTPAPATPSDRPDQGNVGSRYPELSVEVADGYVISITDPEAKAWRFDIRGNGILAEDRLEVLVEVGDIAPGAEARIYTRGALVDIFDMNGMIGDETVSAGGCHPTLKVCFGSDGLAIDPDTGRVTLRLEQFEPGSVAIQGATAGWPNEPFVLGPWRTTEPFST